MKKVSFTLIGENGLLAEVVEAEFSDDDIVTLGEYMAQMGRVREAALIRRGMPFITNMEWNAGASMQFTCAEYSNGELYELLHVLRPLILESEAASFQKTLGLLGRRFQNRTYASHQKAVRRIFEDGELSLYMQVSVGGQKLLDQSMLHTWLNGTQYHTDAEKAADWKKLEASLTTENARAIVISQLHSRVKALFILEHEVGLRSSTA